MRNIGLDSEDGRCRTFDFDTLRAFAARQVREENTEGRSAGGAARMVCGKCGRYEPEDVVAGLVGGTTPP